MNTFFLNIRENKSFDKKPKTRIIFFKVLICIILVVFATETTYASILNSNISPLQNSCLVVNPEIAIQEVAYDNLYRVIGTKYGVSSPLTQGIIGETNQPNAPPFADVTGTKEQSLDLDKEHNRISHTTDGTSTNYQVNSMNQYTEVNGTAFDWDNNGNLTSDGLRTFEYDWENRLLEVNNSSDNSLIASYVYGPTGKRIGKILPDGTTHSYFYDKDWNLVEEYVNNELAREFTYSGLDRPIHSTVNISKFGLTPADFGIPESQFKIQNSEFRIDYFYHQNSIGNVLALTDTTGNVLCRYQYDIDGKCTYLAKDGSVIPSEAEESYRKLNEFLFTARQIDLETMNFYYRNRYYSPDLGRFISVDSLFFSKLISIFFPN